MAAGVAASASALLVRDFVNTVEWQEDRDDWAAPDALSRWFAARFGIAAPHLTEVDLDLARRVREGLRSVLLQHAGHDPLPAVVDDVNEALARIPLRMRVGADGTIGLDGGVASPLAQVLAAVEVARSEGGWERLKACSRDSCRWAYWDGSRNRAGRWCSMAGCGNWAKMRTRSGSPPAPDELLPESGGLRVARLVDVAGLAGVSIKTVSNVVTGTARVAPATRARVEAAIAELDYRPNLTARALRAGRPAP